MKNTKSKPNGMIPAFERRRLRDMEIRRLYRNGKGYSMDQIVEFGYSKTTVFRAIHKGRAKAKSKK